ncbi:hypothetical protein PybrP1_007613 [[Pythium] brassicae (nom. inval.)]|nr:hypothetical protein PybrP1_007613 [[Pythium] brassicae (nom. inval.)]
MAAEWQHVIGEVHSPLRATARATLFDSSVRITANRKVTTEWNDRLTSSIEEVEVAAAIQPLSRHKAPGPDQLPNDFFADCKDALIPWLTPLFNKINAGGPMLASFAEGLIIPLGKNGDSDNAIDYWLITLLSTCYKVFAKVLANRVQEGLQHLIGDTQQGFVKARLLERPVILMHAVLQETYANEHGSADDAPAVILLDFMKAYDMLNREFILLTLQRFGFASEFVNLVGRIHNNTTARFTVNGDLSEPVLVCSGIQQGCPLAPLNFIIAAEVLALMIQGDNTLRGIPVPGGVGEEVKVAVFVNGTAVYLRRAQMAPCPLNRHSIFEKLSGRKPQHHGRPTRVRGHPDDEAGRRHEVPGRPDRAHRHDRRQLGKTDQQPEDSTGDCGTDLNHSHQPYQDPQRGGTASDSVHGTVQQGVSTNTPGAGQPREAVPGDRKLATIGRKHRMNPGL